MVERFADKQIRVLEEICADNFKSNSVSDYAIEISEKTFIQMVEEFQSLGWLKISHTMPLDLSGEETDCDGKTLIYYKLINKKGLSDLLLKLKKEYPKLPKPLIQEKTLELLAIDIGEFDTGIELVRFLQKCGVKKELIVYPNTKWRMIFGILVYLASSARDEDHDVLFSIIGDSIHPLMHNGDMAVAQGICNKFNKYLVYDGFIISYFKHKKRFVMSSMLTEEEEQEYHIQMREEWLAQEEESLKFLQKAENKEKIAIIRKAYQVLINIVETFCQNPSNPTAELNDAYIKVKELARKNAGELKIIGKMESEYHIQNFYFPFFNLFGAEAEFKNLSSKKIDWDEIRPELNRTYGEIDAIFREVNGSDILSEPDIQRTLNDASLLVSEAKRESESKTIKDESATKKAEELVGPEAESEKSVSVKALSRSKDRLKFYSETGNISYKKEEGEAKSGTKGFALLSFFNKSKNTIYNLNDIKEYCNPLVNKSIHYFKKEKDIDDTIRLLKNKLKVSNNAFFPIEKKGSKNDKKWIWIEK